MDLKSILKVLKLNESTISVILGGVVIVMLVLGASKWFSNLRRGAGSITPSAVSESVNNNINLSDQTNPVANTNSGTHMVAKGESLWKISQQYFQGSGYNWIDIARANHLNENSILYVGQKLVIPSVAVKQPLIAQTTGTVGQPNTITTTSYTVKSGDSLWKISLASYGDGYQWVKVYTANKAKIGRNPNKLFAGTILTLPR